MDFLIALGLLKAYTKLTAGTCLSHKCLEGKTAIVTNAKNGIGYEVAQNLSMRGCKVIIADLEDILPFQRIIADGRNCKKLLYRYLDLSSLHSVREFASAMKSTEKRLDILINNSNFGCPCGIYTDDGILKVMQVNYFGQFLLTHLLLDLLKQTPGSRIVFLTSILANFNRIKNVESVNTVPKIENTMLKNYLEFTNSKLCTAAISTAFAERLKGTGVICNTAYPGLVYLPKFAQNEMDWSSQQHISNKTIEGILSFLLRVYGKTMREGAQTILHCALADELNNVSGKYFRDCRQYHGPKLAELREFRTKLWMLSEKLTKLKDEEKLKPV